MNRNINWRSALTLAALTCTTILFTTQAFAGKLPGDNGNTRIGINPHYNTWSALQATGNDLNDRRTYFLNKRLDCMPYIQTAAALAFLALAIALSKKKTPIE